MKDIKRYKDRIIGILTSDELLEFDRDSSSIIDIGYEYVELGDYRRAFKLFSIGARLHESDPDILNGLGIALCELGRFKASRQVLEKAAALYPDDAVTLANLAGVYWEEAEFEKAIHYYARSIEMDTMIPETHFNLINVYYEIGDLFMAYIACLNLLKIYPEDEQGLELRDDILLNLGLSI
ncbi:MAG: tetratricopeptide repeat protein [Spirochaetes bacterium]|nr:MAG: tetratricopeptide repeat protein [Spirochaetota bacterium]